MSVKVNLLPGSYRQLRRHDRRFRLTLVVVSVLLLGELAVGFVLDSRADQTRQLMAATKVAQSATLSVQKAIYDPQHESDELARDVMLAQTLRTKHHWSRLLAAIAQATPEKVVLSSLSTDPPDWNPGLRAGSVVAAGPDQKEIKRQVINGIIISGHAVDLVDLSAFMAAIHASGSFASIDTKEARREKFMNQDAIRFELICRW
jgi:Tfp pilus assembly protein PilN